MSQLQNRNFQIIRPNKIQSTELTLSKMKGTKLNPKSESLEYKNCFVIILIFQIQNFFLDVEEAGVKLSGRSTTAC